MPIVYVIKIQNTNLYLEGIQPNMGFGFTTNPYLALTFEDRSHAEKIEALVDEYTEFYCVIQEL